MPCMSYDTNWAHSSSDSDIRRLKKEADKLARIACAAMTELEKMGKEDFLILKNEEVGQWWAAHKEADRKEQERVAEKERRERVKKEALDRLTDEEKELLGLKRPAAKKTKKINSPTKWDDVDVYAEEEYRELVRYVEQDLQHTYDAIMKRT